MKDLYRRIFELGRGGGVACLRELAVEGGNDLANGLGSTG